VNLRLPASGSLLESLLNHLGRAPNDPSGDVKVEGVTEAHTVDALDALERGDIEYMILEHGDEFLQAAGTGDGPYALQVGSTATETMFEVRGGVDRITMRRVLLGYRSGDAGWRGSLAWTPMAR
jgi:hypothetical protein